MFDGPALAEGTIVGNGDVRGVNYGSDAGLFVEFRMEDVYQEFRSAEEGRPVYEQVPFIRMYVPGDKTKVMDRAVRLTSHDDMPTDPQRFPRQWAAFQSGVKETAVGFPLTQWPLMTSAHVKMLNAANIYTVEALAAVADSALGGLGHGGRAIRDQAIAHLASLQDGAALAKATSANAELQRQIDELKASIADQPRRGRPPVDRLAEKEPLA